MKGCARDGETGTTAPPPADAGRAGETDDQRDRAGGLLDETGAVLYTTMGRLEIRGEGLHILELSQDGGELWMEGKVSALYYTDQPEKGFWRRRK